MDICKYKYVNKGTIVKKETYLIKLTQPHEQMKYHKYSLFGT